MFKGSHSPNIHGSNHMRRMMQLVLIASLPGMLALSYFFGPGILINLIIASITALVTEALILKLRNKDWRRDLKDSSALVTALLLALALPPLVPWWITVIGVSFAITFAKQLYGGLGHNPFNPAMIGYVLLLISFPVQMTAWSPSSELWSNSLGFVDSFALIFSGQTTSGISLEMLLNGFDGYSSATPLDSMKTAISQGLMPKEVLIQPQFNDFASITSKAWFWVNFGFLLGGLFLIWQRCIAWQIAVAMLLGLGLMAFIANVVAGHSYPSMLFHLFSGGTMLCAFFIATDPVTAATSAKGRWIFGFGIGVIIWLIRSWGGYPDAIAFAVLLMNMAAPTIDHYTKPVVYGQGKSESGSS